MKAVQTLGATNLRASRGPRFNRADLPKLAELPIPPDVQPTEDWPEQLKELALHIGPYAALRLVDLRGGEQINVPYSPERSPFTFLDEAAREKIAFVYGGCRWCVPVCRAALARARRAPVISAVRAGLLSGRAAQWIVGSSRTYISYLAGHTSEGVGIAPLIVGRRSDTLLMRARSAAGAALERALAALSESEAACA